jgi:hypothetical protein
MTKLLTRIFFNFYSFILSTTEDFIFMLYFLFLFIWVSNTAPLFRVSLVLEFFLVISETPPCLLLLVKTFRLLDVFRLLTACARTSVPLGHPVLYWNRSWYFYINISMFFSGYRCCASVLIYCFLSAILFLFVCLVFCCCVFVLFLCFICVFVLAL